ncbi:MAG: hypothetical protein JWO82_321 [Akkermansiaceae bacterium]|nr:hypothetical protein [Akkermansiaceae bacterium]
MTDEEAKMNREIFNAERANSYDQRTEKMAPVRDAMLQMLEIALGGGLPGDARVLCVGAGTGTEVIHLAERFPGWRLVAVEPAPAMMAVCREKVREAGLLERCDFHEGYLEMLPEREEGFDAATCLLVSHFFMNLGRRTEFFRGIAARLKPGGWLVSSDLAGDMAGEEYWQVRVLWERVMEGSASAHGNRVDLLPREEMRAMLGSAGFEEVAEIYQWLLIHGWVARRGEAGREEERARRRAGG